MFSQKNTRDPHLYVYKQWLTDNGNIGLNLIYFTLFTHFHSHSFPSPPQPYILSFIVICQMCKNVNYLCCVETTPMGVIKQIQTEMVSEKEKSHTNPFSDVPQIFFLMLTWIHINFLSLLLLACLELFFLPLFLILHSEREEEEEVRAARRAWGKLIKYWREFEL